MARGSLQECLLSFFCMCCMSTMAFSCHLFFVVFNLNAFWQGGQNG